MLFPVDVIDRSFPPWADLQRSAVETRLCRSGARTKEGQGWRFEKEFGDDNQNNGAFS